MATYFRQPVFFPRRGVLFGLSLCLSLALSACTTTPVEPQKKTASTPLELQQQQFEQGKKLYLNDRHVEAAKLLLPLAQQGHIEAQYTVGYMYHYGLGLPRNEKESTRWITAAAARGHRLAQEALTQINASHDQSGIVTAPAAKP